MTREEIEALAAQHGMLGQMVTTNLLVSFAELVAERRDEVPGLSDEVLDLLRRTLGCIAGTGFADLERDIREVIAADRAKRGV